MHLTDWIGAIAGVVGTVVAVGALVVAGRANARSSKANSIAQEALDAQKLALPPPWSSPELEDDGKRYSIRNTSGRTIIVAELASRPGGDVSVFIPPDLPARIQHGDVLYFTAIRGGNISNTINAVSLGWAFEDEPDLEHTTERRY
ncbi:hypothetical protein [Microbacterium aurum]